MISPAGVERIKSGGKGMKHNCKSGCAFLLSSAGATLAILLTILSLSGCRDPVWASEIQWDNFSNEQIVEAIGKAENSIKYPYGIKSIDTKGNKEYARKICLNSVRNGRIRWEKAGQPYDLIIYIGLRYCPPTAHKLNSNWVRNVKFFLNKKIEKGEK